jgi:hypothetical protein
MNWLKYFEGKFEIPKAGVTGKESDWMELAEIEMPRGRLWIGDASVPNAKEGCTVKVLPGQYRVEVKGMDFKGRRVPSRVRVFAKATRHFTLGARVGQAITDMAQVGICDIAELNSVVSKKHMKEFEQDLQAQVTETMFGGQTFLYGKRTFQMAFVASGCGDGAYDVYALESRGKIVGIETEFLPAGYTME